MRSRAASRGVVGFEVEFLGAYVLIIAAEGVGGGGIRVLGLGVGGVIVTR